MDHKWSVRHGMGDTCIKSVSFLDDNLGQNEEISIEFYFNLVEFYFLQRNFYEKKFFFFCQVKLRNWIGVWLVSGFKKRRRVNLKCEVFT